VIFISSAAATGLGGGAYGGAKAALHAWMLDLAVELGPQGVTCNIVSPGFIDETDLFAGRLTDEGRAAYHVRTLVGRGGLPADVADCVRWLAAPASGYVTAQVIGIDGGSLVNSR
jgi:3-oxoacyl-[acyl-carrier protein] reductase